MNILLINYEYPPLGGGAARQSSILASELSKRHTVTVLTSCFRGLPRNEKVDENLTILRVPSSRRLKDRAKAYQLLFFFLSGCLKAISISKQHRIDITVAFFTAPSGYIGLLLKRLYKIPYIVSLRGFDVPGFLYQELGFLQKINLPLILSTWRNADSVVTNSGGLAELAKKRLRGLPMVIIPNAAGYNVTTSDKDRITGSPSTANRPIRILSVGRFTTQKGIEYLLEAFSTLAAEYNLTLDLVGDGPLKDRLVEKAYSLKIEDRVSFNGWFGYERLADIYRSCDIFALLSLEEGMSNAILEAACFGLPIITTDIPGNRDLIEDGKNGLLVPVKDGHAAASKLRLLIEDEGLRKRFSSAGRGIAARFSPEATAAAYEKLCTDVLSKKMSVSDDRGTARAFSNSWCNLSLGSVYSFEQFQDWFLPLTEKDIANKDVLELGCGNGSLMYHLIKWAPSQLTGIDLGDSTEAAIRNMKAAGHTNWHIEKSDLLRYRGKGFDLVYCIGVLHHLKDPQRGFESVLENTKSGGSFHCWVYAKEGNSFVRTCIDPLRKVACRLPWWLTKYLIAMPLAALFFLYANTIVLLRKSVLFWKMPMAVYCLWISKRGFGFFHHVAFDQLVTPHTVYIDKETISCWLKSYKDIDAGSTYMILRNGNSWKFGGKKI